MSFTEEVILEFLTGVILNGQGKLKIGNYQNLDLRATAGNELVCTGRWASCRARSDSVGANNSSLSGCLSFSCAVFFPAVSSQLYYTRVLSHSHRWGHLVTYHLSC